MFCGESVGGFAANPFVMVVYGDGESALGAVLTDDVAIELSPNFTGFG